MAHLKNSLGWKYIFNTKFSKETIYSMPRLNIYSEPPFKLYPDSEIYPLPEPVKTKVELSSLISQRKSHRTFSKQPVTLRGLSTILWSGYGIREARGNFFFRNVPSAGALYPLEIYLINFNVLDVPKGLFHYFPKDHVLEFLQEGDFEKKLIEASLGQDFVSKGGFTILITSVFRRNMSKYGHRGLRYILLDAGHLAQNMILSGEALSIGSCPIGAFFDDELNDLIGINGIDESVIYMLVFGKKI